MRMKFLSSVFAAMLFLPLMAVEFSIKTAIVLISHNYAYLGTQNM